MNLLEVTGFLFGIAGVYLTLRENVWCFPVGIINVILSLFLFYDQKLYADAIQQSVYIFLLTYGWWQWLHGGFKKSLTITKSSSKLLLNCLMIWISGTFLLGSLLHKYTDASTPWPDSAATILSFIAQWMVAKKKLENWILWMVVNLAYIAIYIYKDLSLYAILFFIYLILAIAGYVNWKKQLHHAG